MAVGAKPTGKPIFSPRTDVEVSKDDTSRRTRGLNLSLVNRYKMIELEHEMVGPAQFSNGEMHVFSGSIMIPTFRNTHVNRQC